MHVQEESDGYEEAACGVNATIPSKTYLPFPGSSCTLQEEGEGREEGVTTLLKSNRCIRK